MTPPLAAAQGDQLNAGCARGIQEGLPCSELGAAADGLQIDAEELIRAASDMAVVFVAAGLAHGAEVAATAGRVQVSAQADHQRQGFEWLHEAAGFEEHADLAGNRREQAEDLRLAFFEWPADHAGVEWDTGLQPLRLAERFKTPAGASASASAAAAATPSSARACTGSVWKRSATRATIRRRPCRPPR